MTDRVQTFEVISLFGDAVSDFLNAGLIGKARDRDLLAFHCTDPRDFTEDRHRTVDDTPFGGGPGMVMKVEPVVAAIEHVVEARGPMHTILVTPSAPRFDQVAARRLAHMPRIAIVCGRYEGIDDRVREGWVDECFSLGDFVLNGGEVAALAIIEAVARLRPGVIGNPDSAAFESFAEPDVGGPEGGPTLEHPQYTRPEIFRGARVPEILLGGDHGRIETWRRRAALLRTIRLRPDLRASRRIDPSRPIYVMLDLAELESGSAELDQVADQLAEAGVALLLRLDEGAEAPARPRGRVRFVQPGGAGRRALRRHLRKQHGAHAIWVRVQREDPGAEPTTARSAWELAELLEAEQLPSSDAAAPLVLDLSRDPQGLGSVTDADLALFPVPLASPSKHQGLAIGTPMIDPSQPQSVLPTGDHGFADAPRDTRVVLSPVELVSTTLEVLGRKPRAQREKSS